MSKLVLEYLARGGIVTRCPTRSADGRLHWFPCPHPTRNLPLSLGVVGRW